MFRDLREQIGGDRLWLLASDQGVAVSFDASGPRALLVFSSPELAGQHAGSMNGESLPVHHVMNMSVPSLEGFFLRLFHQGLVDAVVLDADSLFDYRTEPREAPLAWVEDRGTDPGEENPWGGGASLVIKVCNDLEWTIPVPEPPTDPEGLAAEWLGTLATRTPGQA